MVEYAILLFKNLSLSGIENTPQLKMVFVIFGIVCTTIGFWIKKIPGALLGGGAVFLLYLYVSGFFYRYF